MVVHYDRDNDEYYVKERIGNQTVRLVFQMHDWNQDTIYFNVYLTLYNKRNQITDNEAEVKMTGENPLQTFLWFVRHLIDWFGKCWMNTVGSMT